MDINLQYVIFDYSELDKINFDEVYETSPSTIRVTNDGLKTFVKWIGDMPASISALTSKSIIYNNEEMKDILSGPDWNNYNLFSGTTL